jgi:hypothetical protein
VAGFYLSRHAREHIDATLVAQSSRNWGILPDNSRGLPSLQKNCGQNVRLRVRQMPELRRWISAFRKNPFRSTTGNGANNQKWF